MQEADVMTISAASAAYNVDKVRADFPILSMEVYGKPLIYLDNAASAAAKMTNCKFSKHFSDP